MIAQYKDLLDGSHMQLDATVYCSVLFSKWMQCNWTNSGSFIHSSSLHQRIQHQFAHVCTQLQRVPHLTMIHMQQIHLLLGKLILPETDTNISPPLSDATRFRLCSQLSLLDTSDIILTRSASHLPREPCLSGCAFCPGTS